MRYESLIDWREHLDYLRCNPSFNGAPRYDFVIIKVAQGHIIGQLFIVFTCLVEGQTYGIAMVRPFDAPIQTQRRARDGDLGLYRLRVKQNVQYEFVLVTSIVRGALVVEDPSHAGDFLLVDTVDSDMFLRCQSLLSG